MKNVPRKPIFFVEINSGIVYILATIFSLWFPRPVTWGVLAGGVLSIGGLDIAARLVAKAIEDPERIKGGYLILIAVKFIALVAICFGLLYFRLVHPAGLAIGFGSVFVGIVAIGIAATFMDVGLPKDRKDEKIIPETDEEYEERRKKHGKGWGLY